MEPEDLLNAIDDLSPQAQYVLLITIANQLREAVDEGRIGSVVLTQAADHLRVLVDGGPVAPRQSFNAKSGTPTEAAMRTAARPGLGHF